ncbi:MAG: hypothetical protein K2X38_13525 [Gemmataceae bacterium]|nr:hypothetical protein [Gemmataceae bacterium]
MKRFLLFVVVVALIVGVIGYNRGWFHIGPEGAMDVQMDAAKFKQDREAISKTVGEKVNILKTQMAGLFKKTEVLPSDAKADAQKELVALEKEHDRLEQQLRELDEAGKDRFVTVREDLNKNIAAVEQKIADWSKKLEASESK